MKLPQIDIVNELSAFEAVVSSAGDYFPGGMEMPGRTYSSNSYRYGFNGMEKDDEIKGSGNSINYKYRMHDPRLGRFFSVDPLSPKYPWNSPYAFSENRVIDGIELEGLEVLLIGSNTTFAAGIGGEVEGGVAIILKSGEVYGYGTMAINLESDISIAKSISVTLFPWMETTQSLSGTGAGASVSTAKWGANFTGGIVSSGGEVGFNVQVGLGAGIAPFSAQASLSSTSLHPINGEAELETARVLLQESYLQLYGAISDLMAEYSSLISDNEQLLNNNNILESAIKFNCDGSGHETMNGLINKNNDQYSRNRARMTDLIEKIDPVVEQLGAIKKGLDSLD